ncbi:3-hydroxyacyl-CoA dehydrogenase family protein [Persicobacter psychrovividus]|uniref:3-hydroxybutyryl-CoA dehydrogenase n=1 Tax=Persicobacter psychrovividus TaxID=387638 RepID=A0ABM7VFK7_9BACT|nr:3-hydroxybutyryl-CoA dehydrogenase [Persicobacter psychrovividus]
MRNITVIGAGTMGNGIAHVFAQSGFKVCLLDVSDHALEKAINTIRKNLNRLLEKEKITNEQLELTLSNITLQTDMKTAVQEAELVIEAATENIQAKFSIFKQLGQLVGNQVILATNTSSISITSIASQVEAPERVIGMHFMNPVPIMKLVEVIRGYNTTDQTTETIMALSAQLGKTPVEVNDYAGFVANRILMPMINEAIISLQEGVAGVAEIDTVMKLGMAHPMGPLQLADFIGLDVCQSILEVMHEGLGNPKYAPAPLLKNMVMAGKCGVKSGEGFYDYSESRKAEKLAKRFQK